MMRTVPVSSRADRRRLMLKLPPTEPSDRPSAPPSPVPVAAGRLTAKSDGSRDARARSCCASSLPPVDADRRREHEAGRVAAGGARERATAPLDAELADERRPRFDDARLDRDLRRLRVEAEREALRSARGCRATSLMISAFVRSSTSMLALRRQHALELRLELGGRRVVERDDLGARRLGLRPRPRGARPPPRPRRRAPCAARCG